jgi:hypothetical protein
MLGKLGNYKILGDMVSLKHVLFKVFVLLFLIALGYWMLIGFLFTVNLFAHAIK